MLGSDIGAVGRNSKLKRTEKKNQKLSFLCNLMRFNLKLVIMISGIL